ncbi:hypothetical protein HYD86_03915 [Mycoplasmopsis bovis]|nr:hypothetical protein [Mycoplasmopsis bovis]QQH36968.1 hypothetical protein HYD86_03915 [Mycoplasmopsis bovis]
MYLDPGLAGVPWSGLVGVPCPGLVGVPWSWVYVGVLWSGFCRCFWFLFFFGFTTFSLLQRELKLMSYWSKQ